MYASTERVAKYLKPSIAGFVIQKVLDYLVGAIANQKRKKKPFTTIVCGSKGSAKIGMIVSLLEKVDILILDGGMPWDLHLWKMTRLVFATSFIEKAKSKGIPLLPTDVVADKFVANEDSKVGIPLNGILIMFLSSR
ncbi:phosphoglycerate kinase, cytosolic [Olea europaea subsp. europaea]|uniref:phosphoglycerate kinase n=1 Tax=Olea europaea subsp. europaea TaxID=158383 RepID=A0A8S0TZH7_OLEEU|nr:phosphoglycerate kinase, cytosolic [Olea europaea subsp. europaea]